MREATTEPVEASRDSTVSIRVLKALLEFVELHGVTRAQFMRAAQLEPNDVDAVDTRMPRSKIYGLVELAMDLTGNPALGLHWAETMNEGTFVPISHLIAHASTLREGFHALNQFHRLLSDQASFQVVEVGDHVTIRGMRLTGETLRIQRFTSEMMIGGMFRLLRYISRHARAESVNFEYAAPTYQAEYTRVFEMPVRFEQPFTEIVFDRALLDLPAPHQDNDVHEALQVLAERRLLRITKRMPYALRVLELLVKQSNPHKADMTVVARSLGLSVRSLRRRLADEGRSYNEVVNEALSIVAKRLLRDKQRTIQETAFEMGFSDTSTFHRAFKRWTGMTPNGYRDARPHSDEG